MPQQAVAVGRENVPIDMVHIWRPQKP
jgi:hypothetical protein